MDPVIIAAGLTAGANVLGSLLGIDSQSKTNKLNARLYRENLALQKEENQKNRDFSQQMWSLQNEYNLPINQKARLKEAGLNPFLVSGDQVGASPASSVSPPSVSGLPSAPMMQALPFSSLVSSLGPLLQAVQVDSGSQQARASAISQIVNSGVEIYKSFGREAGDQFLTKYLPMISGISDFANSDTHNFIMSQINYQTSLAALNNTENMLKQKYSPRQFEDMHDLAEQKYYESVALIQARIQELNLKKVDQDLKAKELSIYAQSVAGSYMRDVAQAGHLREDAQTISDIRTYLVDSARFKSVSDKAKAVEDKSLSDSRSGLRSFRKTKMYKAGVAAKGLYDEGGVKDASALLIDGLKAVKSFNIPKKSEDSAIPKSPWNGAQSTDAPVYK